MMRKRSFFFGFILCLILSASSLYADDVEIYLYDPEVSSEVDVDQYLATGKVWLLSGLSFLSGATPGPAPDPYPRIHVWETAIEQLGRSCAEIDGINFFSLGRYWVKGKWVLVLWKIRIPQASLREASEFEQDLTLSLWVDWNQDQMWGKNEKMMRKHINIHRFLPVSCETLHVYYLSWFLVPDIDDYMSSSWWWKKKDLRDLWIRGVLSYDDPDVSPDGEQLFGEAEDYQVAYWVIKKKPIFKEAE